VQQANATQAALAELAAAQAAEEVARAADDMA
jgi:hypothetical protein